MGVSAKSLGIDKLPVEERLALVGEIWDGISSDTESLELTQRMKTELDSRLDEADSDPGTGVPWELIEKETRERLKK